MTPDDATAPLLSIEGARATIRFNRLREHNRMDPADLGVLVRHFETIERDAAVKVLVISGTGERTFSAGYTLGALQSIDADAVTFDAMVDRLEDLRVPTIAALNGSVYGGATDLSLACDFRIGIRGMVMRMPASRIGLHYYPGGMRRYVERLGLAAAKRLFLLGEDVGSEQLDAWGYFDALVDRAEFARTVDYWADRIAAGAPTVVQRMKRHCNAIARGAMDEAAIRADYEASLRSTDLAEGLAALAAKRAPRFTGA